MDIKDNFKSGQYAVPVPAGVPITLQYSQKGIFERAFIGLIESGAEVSYTMFNSLYESNCFPVKIPATGGTTFVGGVLYTSHYNDVNGELPECEICEKCIDFIDDSSNYNFFACVVNSKSVVLRGANQVYRWLHMAKFTTLPGFIVPAPVSDDTFMYTMKKIYTCMPGVVGYVRYNFSDVDYISCNLTKHRILDINKFTTEYGYIKYEISLETGHINVDACDVKKFNLYVRTYVILDECNHIVHSFNNQYDHYIYDSLVCDWCGREMQMPDIPNVKCLDELCMSNRYHEFTLFTHTHSLPELTFDEYERYCKSDRLHSVSDLFTLSPWNSFHIESTLEDFLRSVIPIRVVSNFNIIRALVSHCNGNINMLKYYISHPNAINQDFHMGGSEVSRLIQYLSKDYVKDEIDNLMKCENVSIVSDNKKFDGAPIFRDKTIFLTGKFIHGSTDDMVSILNSYSAEVVTSYGADIDCVLVGDMLEDVNSIAVHDARLRNIPVFNEIEFFNKYGIDSDMDKVFGGNV